MLKPNYAWAIQIQPDDKRIKSETAMVPSPQGNGTIKGYLARPAGASGKLPAVLVIHENRGMNPYTQDVVRRLAVAGYMAFSPDGLTSVGGYPGDEEAAAKAFATVDRAKMGEDFLAAAQYLRGRSDCTGKLGAVGFCFGGGVVNNLAVRMGSDLAAGSPFYGAQPAAPDAAKIKTPLSLQYAALDDRITSGWPGFEQVLKANKVAYDAHIYAGANHGFHNDTTPRYDEKAAKEAWQHTTDLFSKYLKS
jgi:carboxymethylenebutenolidase